jgi:hypothetical protein
MTAITMKIKKMLQEKLEKETTKNRELAEELA